MLQKRETADVFRIFLSRSACVCGSLFTLIPSSPINISRRRRTFSSRGSSVDWISWDLAFILKRERENTGRKKKKWTTQQQCALIINKPIPFSTAERDSLPIINEEARPLTESNGKWKRPVLFFIYMKCTHKVDVII